MIDFYSDKPLSTDKIIQTFQASFKKTISKEYLEWRYFKNPNNKNVYINYIVENSTLASYYAVSPNILIDRNGEHFVAMSNMTMTHPDFQGKGYFTQLASSMLDRLRNDGCIFVYGFANHNSHYGFKKSLGWIDLASLNFMRLSKETYRPINKINDFTFEEIPISILSTLDYSEYNIFNTDKFYFSRDQKNLKWRFGENPINEYKVIYMRDDDSRLYIIYKKYENSIDIMEILSNIIDKKRYLFALQTSISRMFEDNKMNISLWSNIHTEEHLIYERIGFREDVFCTYFGIIPLIDKNELINTFDFRNWYLSFMDSDVF